MKNKPKIYFYLILGISLAWVFFVPKPYKNYAPIFFAALTFPVFSFFFFNQFYGFSNAIRKTHPELFQKYILNYGISINRGEILDVSSFFNNADFDQLKEEKLYEKYILCKLLSRLALFSFFIFPLLAIATIYLN